MQIRSLKLQIFLLIQAFAFVMLASWPLRAHSPSPGEIELPPVDTTGYEIQIIEGKWDEDNKKSTQAEPTAVGQTKKPSAAALMHNSAKDQVKKQISSEPKQPEASRPIDDKPRNENKLEKAERHQFSALHVFKSYLFIGFEHILPEGTDHILFVLGLFFFGLGWRVLLMQISIFTLAHTVTLILSTMNFIRLPSEFVEPVIAFSIVFIALENLFLSRLNWRRLVLIFTFGLIHGLGFAGALAEVKLPANRQLLALISFNLGVEIGQLTVVSIAGLLLFLFLKKPWYKKVIANPASVFIAAIGLYWTVTRIFF